MSLLGLSLPQILQMGLSGILLVLFVLFYKDMKKDQRKVTNESIKREQLLRAEAVAREDRILMDSQRREDKLMDYLDDKNKSDAKTASSFAKIVSSLEKMEMRMGNVEKELCNINKLDV